MSRIMTNGFELVDSSGRGLVTLSNISISTSNPRQTVEGSGGIRHLRCTSNVSTVNDFDPLPYAITEGWLRWCPNNQESTSPGDTEHRIMFRDAGGNNILEFRLDGAPGLVSPTLYVNGVLQSITTNGRTFADDRYWRFELYVKIAGGGLGQVTFRVDDDEIFDFIGTTNTAGSNFDRLRITLEESQDIDDMAMNDTYTRVNYTGGTGTAPIPAQTLTDGAAKSATIIHHVGDGIIGYLIVSNAGAAFANADALQNSGVGWTATESGAEDTDHTTWCGEGFIQLFFPTAVGNTGAPGNLTQFGSPGGTNNYEYVDALEVTTDLLQDNGAGVHDTFTMDSLPTDLVSVSLIERLHFVQRDGVGLNNLSQVLRVSAVDYETGDQLIPTSFGWMKWIDQRNPGTGLAWTTGVFPLELGPRFNT